MRHFILIAIVAAFAMAPAAEAGSRCNSCKPAKVKRCKPVKCKQVKCKKVRCKKAKSCCEPAGNGCDASSDAPAEGAAPAAEDAPAPPAESAPKA